MYYTYDFFKDLKRPLHETRNFLLDCDCIARQDEVKITPDWELHLPAQAAEQIKIAAKDLECFLGFRLAGNSGNKISLCIDQSMSQAESYIIEIKGNEISVTGADSSGVMYGVFFLEELMKFRKAPILERGSIRRSPSSRARILRSPMSFYYHEELEQVDQAYPEEYLLKMAHHGFNGLWMRGILRHLAKVDIFPEFGANSDQYLSDLRRLINRAAKYGIKVYLYFTEPLGFDPSNVEEELIAEKYSHLLGNTNNYLQHRAMCSSFQETKIFLKEGMRYLFSNASGLGGVILITASEHHTHCYNSQDEIDCPRCSKREKHEVIAEVISLINEGVKAAAPDAKVIAWNWSWRHFQPRIITELPADVILMADFERGGTRTGNGTEHKVDEYSLNYVGPSERFLNAAKEAKKTAHEVYAKLQICATHEISTVPYYPVLFNLARKFANLREQNVTGAVNCWNFGNFLSRNTELSNWFSWSPLPEDIDKLLLKIACRDFGDQAAAQFVAAWKIFSEATEYFPPFDNKYLYNISPTSFGGAYPLFMERIGLPLPPPWLLPDIKYNASFPCQKHNDFSDAIQYYCGTFGAEKIIEGLRKFCAHWQNGVDLQSKALPLVPEKLRDNAEQEIAVCTAIHSQLTSTANVTEFFHVRGKYFDAVDPQGKKDLLCQLKKIAKIEIENSIVLKRCIERDKRLGFHGEAFGYFYTPEEIDRKIQRTKGVLDYNKELLK